jgi:hypothetical protein
MTQQAIKTILIFLITSSAWGQTTIRGTNIPSDGIVSDTTNSSPNKDFEDKIDLKPIDASSYDFEIRFYRLTAATNKRNLRIIRCAGGEWEALEYENTNSKIQKHLLIPTIGYETFLTTLTKHNFTTLPDQSEVDKEIPDRFKSKKEYLQSRPTITDGYEYTIEFKIADKFRVYRFVNPELYVRYYNNVEAFRNYLAIQKIFEQNLARK